MNEAVESKSVTVDLCRECGADVRSGSDFCYNCGAKIAAETSGVHEAQTGENGFRATGPGAAVQGKQRRHRRPLRKPSTEPAQVVWKRDEGAGIRFLILSLVVGLLAMLLVGIAMYLR